MKKNIIIVVLVIGCVAIGAAGGFFVTNSKNKTVLTAMQADFQKEITKTQETLRGYNIMIDNLNGQLQIAKLELDTYKSGTAPVESLDTASAQTTESTTTASAPQSQPVTRKPVARQSTASQTLQYEMPDGPPAGSKQYTIQSGDSLWSIAQKQLGNGTRFQEILKLNPRLTAKSSLVVGSRINLPAK